MSDTPETDAVTLGLHYGPFVEALADRARKIERERDMLRRQVEEFWKALEASWDIEPRSFFEANAEKHGWTSPLAMAVHYMLDELAEEWYKIEKKGGGGE